MAATSWNFARLRMIHCHPPPDGPRSPEIHPSQVVVRRVKVVSNCQHSVLKWTEIKTTTATILVTLTVTLTLTHITVQPVSAKRDLTLPGAGKKVSYFKLKEATWETADDDCLGKGDNLMMAKTPKLDPSYRTLFGSGSNSSNSLFWIGGYVTFSSWKWADGLKFYSEKGCFHEGETGSTKGGRYMGKANGPELCFHVCENYTTISLGDEICFCVDDLSEVISVPSRQCNKPCWKIRDQMCGGEEANSMYERDPHVPHFALWESAHPEVCASLVVESDGSQYLKSENCSEKHGFICTLEQISDHTNNSIHVCHMLHVNDVLKMSWPEARDRCEKNGGQILPEFLPDYGMCPLNSGTYWIGLTRTMNWTWIDRTVISSDIKYNFAGRCLAAELSEDSSLKFYARNCSERLPYICGNDYQHVFTPTRVSSVATTAIYMSSVGNDTDVVGTTLSQLYDSTNDDVFVTIGVAVAICVLFMGAVIVVGCLRKRKKLKKSTEAGYNAEVNGIEDLEGHIYNVEDRKPKHGVKVHVNTHHQKPVYQNIHTDTGITTI
ncbi:uncharacterized protein LOC121385149 [Gigantopelta aegis]|uniref:uncharacterized protein LOC121385149 n=1 Tax=Gigantopelta aegis TaxID=1735272 RepID=UPI001B88C268|nr:uncharacterized protein LOC121385149 [Gigantopelta aegis]